MLPEAKSLRWLANAFPLTIPAVEESDKLCNAIHLYAQNGANKLEAQANEIDELKRQVENFREIAMEYEVKVQRTDRTMAELTASIRKYVSLDNLCHLCQHEESCATEALDEDGQITRYWRCRAGENFELKEG